ncbi:MAG TPA: hypothetical protein PKY82_21935 [Pyrinomonadaceae bacterium]|nr:hypothetical protein [Pyrinomonadaceae bacterium]
MTEIEKNKEAASNEEDWAIIPFDEAEDDARWSKLIEETDQLIEETRDLEAVHGKILMENKLSEIVISQEETEDNPF